MQIPQHLKRQNGKVIQTESSESGGQDDDPGNKDKGFKREPMPRWQKISYWITGLLFGGLTIANGVLFCK